MKCNNCKWPNRPGEIKCVKCGAPLSAAPFPAPDSPVPGLDYGAVDHNPTVVNFDKNNPMQQLAPMQRQAPMQQAPMQQQPMQQPPMQQPAMQQQPMPQPMQPAPVQQPMPEELTTQPQPLHHRMQQTPMPGQMQQEVAATQPKRLVQPRNSHICPRCGYALIPGMTQCPNCSYQLASAPKPAPAPMPNPPAPAPIPISPAPAAPARYPTLVDQPVPVSAEPIPLNPIAGDSPIPSVTPLTPPPGFQSKAPIQPVENEASAQMQRNERGTVNVYTEPGTEDVPAFSLTPVKKVNEPQQRPPVEFKGQEAILNRANVDPDNFSITSRRQASIANIDGKWVLTDLSDQQTTFVHAAPGHELKDGDMILLGNRLFIFHT